MPIDWESLLTVDCEKLTSLFIAHEGHSEDKLQIRGYSLPFVGTQQRWDAVIDELSRLMLKYVFPETERPEDIEWHKARDKFGDISPLSDGKLGEMLLYFLVEAALKVPLMGYKLKDLSNPNDQVKGADGLFVGEYQGETALLIGESKIHKRLKGAVFSAIASLQRFHDRAGPYVHELFIARKYPKERGLNAESIESVLNIIDGTDENRIVVHPVLIAYDFGEIEGISRRAKNKAEADNLLKEALETEVEDWKNTIADREQYYPKPYQTYLDFFFIPAESSLQLREQFYERLHGRPFDYEKAELEKKLKAAIKAAKAPKKAKA